MELSNNHELNSPVCGCVTLLFGPCVQQSRLSTEMPKKPKFNPIEAEKVSQQKDSYGYPFRKK